MKIADISEKDIGKVYSINATVKTIKTASGNTLLELRDETGSMKAIAKSHDILLGETIEAKVLVSKNNNEIEFEVIGYNKAHKFLIQSETLEMLRTLFIEASALIKKAIKEDRPVIIRHHDDTDGYTAGLVIERAIRQIKEKLFMTRSSSKTPYYDYTDALRDINTYLFQKKRYGLKSPLVILCDLGSNRQSIASIRRIKLYEAEVLIIDHHHFDLENQELTLLVNPQVYNQGSEVNSGALACEISRLLNPNITGIKHLPALSGTADRSSGKDFEAYLKLSGYDKNYLEKWALAIDHETYYMKFQESSELLEDLFFPTKNNEKLIEDVSTDIEKDFAKMRESARKYMKIIEMKTFKVIMIDKSKASNYGEYASSKIARITHDLMTGPRVTVVETEDSISFRADEVPGFSVVNLLNYLQKKMPFALLDGGGHDFAGNIRFNPGSKSEVIEHILEYLHKL